MDKDIFKISTTTENAASSPRRLQGN